MNKVFAHDIIKEELRRYHLSWEDLRSDTKTADLVKIRHYIMWRARKEAGTSFPKLGRIFNRDHTSVIYAYNKTEQLYRKGGILQICPPPSAKAVGEPRVAIPLRSRAASRRLLQLIYMDGKWSAGHASH